MVHQSSRTLHISIPDLGVLLSPLERGPERIPKQDGPGMLRIGAKSEEFGREEEEGPDWRQGDHSDTSEQFIPNDSGQKKNSPDFTYIVVHLPSTQSSSD